MESIFVLFMFLVFFRSLFESREGDIPEIVQVVAHRQHSPGIDLAKIPGAFPVNANEPGILQDLQMLRHRRPAHGQPIGYIHNRQGTHPQFFENGPAGRVAQRIECFIVTARGLLFHFVLGSGLKRDDSF